jgi:plasmid replication initiation protein
MYRVIELAQADLAGKTLTGNYSINKTLFDDRIIQIPIRQFLNNETDKNHLRVKEALMSLRNKTIEYETSERWEVIGFIEKPVIKKFDDIVEFEINPKVWYAILNFAKGYSKYELKTAWNFETTYAMRLYELISNQKNALIFLIENLKKILFVADKYKMINDFIKRIIIPAKLELDKSSPYSFDYQLLKTGRKITSIKLIPKYIFENEDKELQAKRLEAKLKKNASARLFLPDEIVNYLKNFNLTSADIKTNLNLLVECNNTFDLAAKLSEKKRYILAANDPKSYLFAFLRKELKALM